MWNTELYPPFKVRGNPTRLDLEWPEQRRHPRRPWWLELIGTDIAGRDHQIAAIRSVLEGWRRAVAGSCDDPDDMRL